MRYQDRIQRISQETLCKQAGVEPTPASLHRVQNGYSIVARNLVKLVTVDADGTRNFEVRSQNDESQSYRVTFNGTPATYCNCPDWRKNDLIDAAKGIPFSLHQCKHGLAARLAWALNRYRLDDFGGSSFHFTPRELKHRLNLLHGEGGWKIVPFKDKYGFNSKKRGRVYAKNGYGKWRKTIENVRKCADDRYYLGSR